MIDIQYNTASTIIFLITLGVSLWALLKDPRLFNKFVLHPYSVVRYNRWHTLITSGFIHADFSHLLFNILTFYFFAFQLESLIGSINFIVIYFISMVIADLPSLIKNRNNERYSTLGASGAISGILFSFILRSPDSDFYLLIIPIGIPAPIFGILYLIYCWYASKNAKDNINHDAHLYGALAGLIVTIILIPNAIDTFLDKLQYVF